MATTTPQDIPVRGTVKAPPPPLPPRHHEDNETAPIPSTPTVQNSHVDLSAQTESILRKIFASRTAAQIAYRRVSDGPSLVSFEEFKAWFADGSASSALAPAPKHDLSYPISNYYISSSHNTYLSGNQFYGAATGDAYRNVLLRGCRCLEIDVWDGDDDDSSVSSSDMEDAAEAKHHQAQSEGSKRDRANSALSRLAVRAKEKASRLRSPSRSPGRGQASNLVANESTPSILHQAQALKGEPVVKHGYTLTKKIPFRTVCHAIVNAAFVASNLPVIVSLEVHCSLEQQEIMVEILQHVFKEHLVDANLSGKPDIRALPSPADLRNKILIKVKWSPNTETGESNDPLDVVQSNEQTTATGNHVPSTPEQRKKASKILNKLSAMGPYTRAYTFKHFGQPEAKIPTHVFSLGEAKVEDIHADPQHGPALFEHNKHFLMRVFPSGLRIDSSNVEPCFLWRQGAQMVALNWQKLDRGMMLNEGMFSGEEGWVLKPTGFRSVGANDDNAPPSHESTPRRQLLDLEIELIAAQNLPAPIEKDGTHLPKMKPYVKMQLHVDTHGPPGQGPNAASTPASHARSTSRYTTHLHSRHSNAEDEEEDNEERRLKRKSRHGRSADPDFGGDVMRWNNINDVVDELSFLRIKIHDDHTIGNDPLIAWACIKLNRLRDGYRFINLLDASGQTCQGVLLVRIEKVLSTA